MKIQNLLIDVSLTWNNYPKYIFHPVSLRNGENLFLFRFSNCYNTSYEPEHSTMFWDIFAIKAKGFSQPAGFVFHGKGEVVLFTEKAISSCRGDNSYDHIASAIRTKGWSARGIDLIRYDDAGEVITDLPTIMGIDVTVDLQ